MALKLMKAARIITARNFFSYSNQISTPIPDVTTKYVEAKKAVEIVKSGKRF